MKKYNSLHVATDYSNNFIDLRQYFACKDDYSTDWMSASSCNLYNGKGSDIRFL